MEYPAEYGLPESYNEEEELAKLPAKRDKFFAELGEEQAQWKKDNPGKDITHEGPGYANGYAKGYGFWTPLQAAQFNAEFPKAFHDLGSAK